MRIKNGLVWINEDADASEFYPGALPIANWAEEEQLHEMSDATVDDNPMNRLVLRRQLEQLGCTVTEACDGQEAVDRLSSAQPSVDLVLMDCQMPRLSGVDATRQIRTRHDARALPIVALTATAVATERAACLEAGMNDFLTKPTRPERLRVLLNQIRDRR